MVFAPIAPRNLALRNEDRKLFADILRRACSYYPTGTVVLGALNDEGKPFGFLVSSLVPVSDDPPLVVLFVKRTVAVADALSRINNFSLSVLREDQVVVAKNVFEIEVSQDLSLPWTCRDTGMPVIENALAVLIGRANSAWTDLGQHQMLTAEMEELTLQGGEPLVRWRGGFYKLNLETPHLTTSATLDQFLNDWEKGILPKSRWNHVAHLTVVACYVFDCECDAERAYQRMKAGLVNYNRCVGIRDTEDSGYHETLTRFWVNLVCDFVREGNFSSRLEAVRRAVKAFGSERDYYRWYYSFDLKSDRRSRREFVAPDRQPPW
jgi:flavin reductase (DIM6/NTAB) family NADH-FMN oxidoreductase RutF